MHPHPVAGVLEPPRRPSPAYRNPAGGVTAVLRGLMPELRVHPRLAHKSNLHPRVCAEAAFGSSHHRRPLEFAPSISCPSSSMIRKSWAAKLHFLSCEKSGEVNKIETSGPHRDAIRVISDCQPLDNELQRIDCRRNQL